ncbi:MAG TPA: SMP-30/gluconolactonase/LRE family protein [Bryobacteraceae bacterium]|nr:SMP-30/gluconolactonase/LRE family protein [Bryobacteraceae bacterium]
MSISRLLCLAVGILWCGNAGAQQFNITTVVGNGTPGFAGDSGAAASAQLMSPGGLALDSSGKLYIADSGNHRIRVVSGSTISTIAGNGTAGFAGDSKAATAAELNGPAGVAVDSKGNVYIADTANHVIRLVNPSGTISTFAGNNTAGYSGDSAVATSAQLFSPTAVIVDSAGNVDIADSGNNVIRQVTSTNNIYTIVGGSATTLQLNHPTGLALDASGALYIADTANRRIVKFAGGTATAFAGNGTTLFSGDNGPATKAGIDDPAGVCTDAAGNVYITDTFNNRIRRVTPDGIITTVAGNGHSAYSGDGGPAITAGLSFPRAVVADASGNVYVADSNNNVVRLLQAQTPAIFANGVVNAGSFTPQVSSGALASIFGSNFAGLNASASLPLPLTLGGVSVTVNGRAAPLLFVSSGQINFQVPWETGTGSAKVVVSNGVSSNTATVAVLTAAPGLFTLPGNRAIVQNIDFSLNGPNNPAKVGSTIVAYLTGSGPVNPPVATGGISPTSPLAVVTSSVGATIGPASAQVAFAGLTPGFIGLLQMNIVVPSSLAPGDYPLTVSINGEASNSATISVGN